MASQTQGIQQLLAAEKKATDKVLEAKKRKALRLKTAKKEADAEITTYKMEREKGYREYEETVLGSKSDMETQIQLSMEMKIKELAENYRNNKANSIRSILENVQKIDVELHENLKLTA